MLIRLITNGSLLHRLSVQQAIASRRLGRRVWFKVDAATPGATARINGVRLTSRKIGKALALCAELAPTWIQTCCFAIDGEDASETDVSAYLELIGSVCDKTRACTFTVWHALRCNPVRLSRLSSDSLQRFAERFPR